MELQERINKAKPYFVLFNIAENVAYSLIKTPNGWTVPSDLVKVHGVQYKKDTETANGIYFFADLTENTNGIEAIFNAIDYTIEFNLTIEERANIFREKAEILKNLIYTEPIDKLKTLEFTFKKMPKKSKTKKTKNIPKTEEVVINEPEKTEQVTENDNSVDSMMELAKSMTEEQE